MGRSNDEIVATLLDRYGTTFADELGIDLEQGTPMPLYKMLVAATLMSARIGTTISVAASRGIFDAGWSTPEKLADSTWQERVDVLNGAGYTRYQEQTSDMLGHNADLLLDRWNGDLRELRERAGRDPRRERELLRDFKGMGDVGVDIFFRETQVAWDELFPFADEKALDAARTLGIGSDVDDLRRHVADAEFPVLVAALVRADNAGDLDAIREGRTEAADRGEVSELLDRTKSDLYEEAQGLGISGRSGMDKRELAEAISRREAT